MMSEMEIFRQLIIRHLHPEARLTSRATVKKSFHVGSEFWTKFRQREACSPSKILPHRRRLSL
jgi:hypothetical protein